MFTYDRYGSYGLFWAVGVEMRTGIVVILVLFVAGCETVPMSSSDSQSGRTGGNPRYECSAFQSSRHVLTLPVPSDSVPLVIVTLHGDAIEAVYSEVGLMKNWYFTDDIFIRVKPDMSAQYYDFTGADAGEERMPQAMFECRKRR